MSVVLLAARVILAAVFVAAGIAKLVDPSASRKGAADLGAPAWLASPIGILLPVAEITVAALLVPVRSAWWGGVSALALLLLFLIVIGISLARGRRPACRCFGQLRTRPIGWQTLARNGALTLIALLIVVEGSEDAGISVASAVAGATLLELAVMALALTVLGTLAAQTWLTLQVFRLHGRLLLRMDALEGRGTSSSPQKQQGLPLGAPAPTFTLPSLRGGSVGLNELCGEGGALLFFVDPYCGPCETLVPRIATWHRKHGETTSLAVLTRGSVDANRTKYGPAGVDVLLQKEDEVADAYNVHGTPAAVFVRPDGTIGSRVVISTDSIAGLVADVVARHGVTTSAAAAGAERN